MSYCFEVVSFVLASALESNIYKVTQKVAPHPSSTQSSVVISAGKLGLGLVLMLPFSLTMKIYAKLMLRKG